MQLFCWRYGGDICSPSSSQYGRITADKCGSVWCYSYVDTGEGKGVFVFSFGDIFRHHSCMSSLGKPGQNTFSKISIKSEDTFSNKFSPNNNNMTINP